MKRRDFFNKFGLGAIVALTVPSLLIPKKEFYMLLMVRSKYNTLRNYEKRGHGSFVRIDIPNHRQILKSINIQDTSNYAEFSHGWITYGYSIFPLTNKGYRELQEKINLLHLQKNLLEEYCNKPEKERSISTFNSSYKNKLNTLEIELLKTFK